MSSSALPKILFLGTPAFAAAILEFILVNKLAEVPLVITQPDRPAGRGKNLQPSPVKQIALKYNIPILQPEKIKRNQTEFIESCRKHAEFDLALVVAYGQILPIDFLNFPKQGCLNVHASLLPRWRGAAPIQHSLLAGDAKTGICLMKMDSGLDTGPVYTSGAVSINNEDNFESLHNKLISLSQDLLQKNLAAIARGEITPQPQSNTDVTYASKIENATAKIDWQNNTAQICNLIRAFSPQPGAFCFFNKLRLKILKAESLQTTSDFEKLALGQLTSNNQELAVRTIDGMLKILELQLEGKRPMSARDFLLGNSNQLNKQILT